jgi:hypothetical protein
VGRWNSISDVMRNWRLQSVHSCVHGDACVDRTGEDGAGEGQNGGNCGSGEIHDWIVGKWLML